jgi:undecaprenyl-diphosphatase
VSYLQILVLSLVQGLTEFLPVSSSGHLILVPELTGWPDQGLAIDVASHVGTLLAVLIYFWRDIARMLAGLGRLVSLRPGTAADPGARLAGYLLIGTIPALLIGLPVERYGQAYLRNAHVVAWAMLGFAAVLYIADRIGPKLLRVEDMRARHALIIGLVQVLAFVPGTSRSGVTMVAGRLLGFQRAEAARFSFLLSVPAIAAAGIWEGLKLYRAESVESLHDALLVMVLSAVFGLLAIAVLMRWLRRFGFMPFVIYRVILGIALLGYLYF